MPPRGRKPNPAGLRAVTGAAKQHPERTNKDEPLPTGELGAAPKHLTSEARKIWEDMRPRVFWATDSDREAFGLLVQALADGRAIRRSLARTKYKGNGRDPRDYRLRDAEDRAVRLMTEFGATPSSRTRVKAPSRPDPNDPLRGR